MSRPLRLFLKFIVILLALYASICAGMYGLQRQLLYYPDARDIALDVQRVPGATVVKLATADGATLNTWWVAPSNPAKPVYLYFPGNADTLAARDERFNFLVGDGAGLLALSWRGYGGSSGSPTETALKADALLAYQHLRQTIDPQRIIVFGESLGTAMAIWVSSQQPSAALVLDSAFPSITAIAQGSYPWLPVQQLLLDTYNSLALAPRISVPVLALHCQEDPVVPFAQGQILFKAFTVADKHLEVYPRRCHVPTVAPIGGLLRKLESRLTQANSRPGL